MTDLHRPSAELRQGQFPSRVTPAAFTRRLDPLQHKHRVPLHDEESSGAALSSATPNNRGSSNGRSALPLSNGPHHRLMWTPELAIREIIASDRRSGSRRAAAGGANNHSFDNNLPRSSSALDIQSFPTSSSAATPAVDFETTSADHSQFRIHDDSFDEDAPPPPHSAKGARRSALLFGGPQSSTPPPSLNKFNKPNYSRSVDRGGGADSARGVVPSSEERYHIPPKLDVSPIFHNDDLNHNLVLGTPAPKFLHDDTTIDLDEPMMMPMPSRRSQSSSRRGGGGHMDDGSMMMQRELHDLRDALIVAQRQSTSLAGELNETRHALNDTSINVGVRERECVELNDFVDALQSKCFQLQDELLLVKGQLAVEREKVKDGTAHTNASPTRRSGHSSPLSSHHPSSIKADVAELRAENKRLANSLANANVEIAQMKAILDRLGLVAPFPIEMIGSARNRIGAFSAL